MQKAVLISIDGPSLESMIFDAVDKAIKINYPSSVSEVNPYGDFNWLIATCTGIPASTLRIKSASGGIPGVIKLGKRVLYEKATVLDWLRSQTKRQVDLEAIEQEAEAQMSRQLAKKGGKAK